MPRFPRPGRLFRNESGAFDLPSVLIGVAVVAILAIGVMALIFGAIPWAQNRAAAQDLAALTTAQGAAKAKDGGYVDPTRMDQLGYLSDDATLDYSVAADESCWVGVTKAKSGKHFYTVDGSAPAELTRGTKAGCLGSAIKFESIRSAGTTACGLSSGTAYCWGKNDYGQLGDGSTKDTARPVKAAAGDLAGKQIAEILNGESNSCAIDADRHLYCWGYNGDGRVGNGTTVNVSAPVLIQGALSGKNITSAHVKGAMTCAVAEEKLYCWGQAVGGASTSTLGDAADTSRSVVPLLIEGGALRDVRIKSVSAGPFDMCVLSLEGKSYCWGGWLAGSTMGPSAVDMSTVDGGSFSTLGVGNAYACGLGSGKVYCWGSASSGKTGNGNEYLTSAPTAIAGAVAGRRMEQLSVSDEGSCSADAGGQWFCWGPNNNGQMGTGDKSPVLYPQALNPSGALSGAPSKVSIGHYSMCVLEGGTPYCVGANYGMGPDFTDSTAFKKVPEPAGAAKTWVDMVLDGGRLP